MFKVMANSATKKAVIPLIGEWTSIYLHLNSTATVKASVDGEQRFVFPPGPFSNFYRLQGEELVLESSEPFNYESSLGTLEIKERVDDVPIPEPKRAMNILQQMRQEFARSLGVMREPFESDLPYPGYEIDDEEPMLFEEELAAQAKKDREEAAARKAAEKDEKAAQTAKSDAEGGSTPEGNEGAPAASEKPTGAK